MESISVVIQINEHNGVALACKHHPLFEYVLSTYRMDTEHNNAAVQRQYFYNKEQAFESFATRSGLIDELHSVGKQVDKIEDLIPELSKKKSHLISLGFFN
ncbi:MAG: hypothetical protein R3Y47_12310 [Lachnospiraceae bacterium]